MSSALRENFCPVIRHVRISFKRAVVFGGEISFSFTKKRRRVWGYFRWTGIPSRRRNNVLSHFRRRQNKLPLVGPLVWCAYFTCDRVGLDTKSRKMAEKSNWKFPKKMLINLILSFQISKSPLKIPMYFHFFFQK